MLAGCARPFLHQCPRIAVQTNSKLSRHGFTLGKDSPAASRICKQLASEGVGMLRFDNLGLGDSEGDWGDGSYAAPLR